MLKTQDNRKRQKAVAAIREAKLYDAMKLAGIWNAAIPPGGGSASSRLQPVSASEMKQRIHQDQIWVAISETGEVIGWCGLGAYYPGRAAFAQARELSVYVAKHARGCGVATTLVRHALSYSRRRGIRTVLATIFSLNLASVRLHESLDFQLVGTVRNVAVTGGVRRDLLIFAYDTQHGEVEV